MNKGNAYVVRNDRQAIQIFFAQHVSRFRVQDEPEDRIQASGYLYSSIPLSENDWIEVPKAHPPFESMSTWGKPSIRPRWYYIEPFDSQ